MSVVVILGEVLKSPSPGDVGLGTSHSAGLQGVPTLFAWPPTVKKLQIRSIFAGRPFFNPRQQPYHEWVDVAYAQAAVSSEPFMMNRRYFTTVFSPQTCLLLLLGTCMFLADQSNVQAQGFLQRLIYGRQPAYQPAPRQQYAPRPQYAPQQNPYVPQTNLPPQNQIQQQSYASPSPSTAPSIASTSSRAGANGIPNVATQMRTYQVRPQVLRIDSRTGRQVVASTGQIITLMVNPLTNQGYAVDPRTKQRIALDSRTGAVVSPSPGMEQVITFDPRTGRMSTMNRPIASSPVPAATVASEQARPTSDGLAKPGSGKSILQTGGSRHSQSPIPTLGIQVGDGDSPIPALKILDFKSHSLADEAGLKVGDHIYSANNRPTPDVASLGRVVRESGIGKVVRLRVGRGSGLLDVDVKVVERPVPVEVASTNPAKRTNAVAMSKPASPIVEQPAVRLGVEVEDGPGTRGVVVVGVDSDSPAQRAGIRIGDRIVSIDGRVIINSAVLVREVTRRSTGDLLQVQLDRNGKFVSSSVNLANSIASSPPAATPSNVPSNENTSALSGVGSMLGGFFGGSKAKSPAASQTVTSPTESTSVESGQANAAKPSIEDSLPDPVPSPAPNAVPFSQGAVAPASAVDEMAFGDEEPIQRSVFESTAPADPPSVQKLSPPMKLNAPKNEPKKTVAELEEEIRRLKAQLNQ